MKKYIFTLVFILLCISGAGGRKVEAYSVTVQEDGMYGEVVPDSILKNAPTFFEKYVKKAMKYYDKYKDADEYTLATKVPDKYRDFIPVAKKIQESDEIIIKNPFYIYNVTMKDASYEYYFVAEKNGKKLCLFSIGIDVDNGETSFRYDKLMNRYFLYDEKTMEEALFYKMDDITYAQTPEKISIVRDQTSTGLKLDGGNSNTDAEKFEKKSYDEKKEEIFAYLTKIKKGRITKKSDKDIKLELKDEYIEPEKDTKEHGIGKGVYVVIGIVLIGGIAAGIFLGKRRNKG